MGAGETVKVSNPKGAILCPVRETDMQAALSKVHGDAGQGEVTAQCEMLGRGINPIWGQGTSWRW